MRNIKIALLGFGNVGTGVFKIFNTNREEIFKRSGCNIEISKILVRDKEKERSVYAPKELFTTDFNDILEDDDIKIIVEVMGGVESAKEYILKGMEKRKHIVTANKMLLALEGDILYRKADENSVGLNYEASVAGGIPIIGGINEGLAANKIQSLYGIINGTTNYILSKMQFEGKAFEEALMEAKEKGYAEADPTSDIEGYDAQYKVAILASLAFGTKIDVKNVYREGISKITKSDIDCANEFGYVIKLLGIIKEVDDELELRVHPTMISKRHPLANVNDSFNAIFVKGNAVGDLMFYGKGAGDLPTGSAVVSDIISIVRNNIVIESEELVTKNNLWKRRIREFKDIESKYYTTISVEDKIGVLGRVTTVFGENNVSVKFIAQREVKDNFIKLVITTHETKEKNIKVAIKKLKELEKICTIHNVIRIEEV
ncbi:homoserine dehydrogenase [uncultured Clostridium sp.]|uniref:homoserine dehydrogenase n=1 Tax=uncultured Clostridium sp. TaxID=59620 RepID=UPI00262D62A0|nr:homoserine dehydrogenase [uncultured Clostridium sp.]